MGFAMIHALVFVKVYFSNIYLWMYLATF